MSSNSKPTVKELLEDLSDLVDWELFASYLPGVSQGDIDGIKKMKDKYQAEKRELFNIWLKRCPTASWLDVAVALHKVKEIDLEKFITDKHNLLPQTPQTPQTNSSHIHVVTEERPILTVPPLVNNDEGEQTDIN